MILENNTMNGCKHQMTPNVPSSGYAKLPYMSYHSYCGSARSQSIPSVHTMSSSTPSVHTQQSQLVRAHVGRTSGVPPRHFGGEAEHRNGQTQKRADNGPTVRANNAQSPIGTPASKSGASVPHKPSGANHESTIEREPLPYVWTCNLCKAATRQRTMRKLREWRSNHMAYSHKTERQQVNVIKRRITILAAGDLPQDNAGWVCAFCNKGIPHALQNQLSESARAHLMGHARKGQTLSLHDNWVRLQKRRHPRITGNRMSLASTRRRVANNIQEIEQSSGHQLVYFPDQRRPEAPELLQMLWFLDSRQRYPRQMCQLHV